MTRAREMSCEAVPARFATTTLHGHDRGRGTRCAEALASLSSCTRSRLARSCWGVSVELSKCALLHAYRPDDLKPLLIVLVSDGQGWMVSTRPCHLQRCSL